MYTIEFDHHEYTIKATAQSKINLTTALELIAEIVSLAKQTNCFYILINLNGEELDFSMMDILALPRAANKIINGHGIRPNRFKWALVGLKDQETNTLYEKISNFLGHNVRLFHQIGAARYWLQTVQSDYFLEKDRK